MNKYNICFVACMDSKSRWAEVFKIQFYYPLNLMGHNVYTICPSDYIDVDSFNLELINFIVQNNIDVMFSLDNEKIVYNNTLSQLSLSTKTVLIVTDNSQNPFPYIKTSKYYELVWFLDNYNQELFEVNRDKRIYLPWAANPIHKSDYSKYNLLIPRVVYVGSLYGSRVKMINDLLHHNIPVDIYLTIDKNIDNNKVNNLISRSIREVFAKFYLYFRMYYTNNITRRVVLSRLSALLANGLDVKSNNLRLFDRVPYSQISEIYQSYRLVLNSPFLNSTGYSKKPVEVINLRTMEIVALGGLMLSEKSKLIENLFTDKDEIIFYNKKNIKEIISYYLYEVSDTEIIRIRNNGHKKFIKYHTWEKRFNFIFDKLNLNSTYEKDIK